MNRLLFILVILGNTSLRATSGGGLLTIESIENIYIKLQEKVGDKQVTWPELRIWSVEDRGAVFVPKLNRIYIDQKLVEACQSFGEDTDDAFAFILAHEMTHYYQAHHWAESGLFESFLHKKEAVLENQENEAEADIFGAFIAQQAGYNVVSLVAPLLEEIYRSYELKSDASSQYPSLSERKKLAAESCNIAADLIEVYQMANYLMVLAKFEAAYLLYNHVKKYIQFKELHYNIAVSQMSAYRQLSGIELRYPLSIDSRGPIERNILQRTPGQMLEAAIRSNDLVLNAYDPEYMPAKFQLITLLDWAGEKEKADSLIALYNRVPSKANDPIFLLTKANFRVRNQGIEQGRKLYQLLLQPDHQDSPFQLEALQNLELLNKAYSSPKNKTQLTVQNETQLDGVSSILFYKDYQRNLLIREDLHLKYGNEFHSVVSRLEWQTGRYSQQRITDSEINTKEGLRIGQSQEYILDKYTGQEVEIVHQIDGAFVLIPARGLIFKLNQSGIIEEWISFSF